MVMLKQFFKIKEIIGAQNESVMAQYGSTETHNGEK